MVVAVLMGHCQRVQLIWIYLLALGAQTKNRAVLNCLMVALGMSCMKMKRILHLYISYYI